MVKITYKIRKSFFRKLNVSNFFKKNYAYSASSMLMKQFVSAIFLTYFQFLKSAIVRLSGYYFLAFSAQSIAYDFRTYTKEIFINPSK